MKTKNILLISAGAFGIAGLGYWLYSRKKGVSVQTVIPTVSTLKPIIQAPVSLPFNPSEFGYNPNKPISMPVLLQQPVIKQPVISTTVPLPSSIQTVTPQPAPFDVSTLSPYAKEMILKYGTTTQKLALAGFEDTRLLS